MAVQVQTQLNATDTQLAALQARAMDLRTKLSGLEGRIVAAPEVEREYQAVTRDLASARAKYDELLKRQMDAEVSEAAIAGGTADKFRVKSSPKIPTEPAKPARLGIAIIAIVLGAGRRHSRPSSWLSCSIRRCAARVTFRISWVSPLDRGAGDQTFRRRSQIRGAGLCRDSRGSASW